MEAAKVPPWSSCVGERGLGPMGGSLGKYRIQSAQEAVGNVGLGVASAEE